jgi:hypothetical protein
MHRLQRFYVVSGFAQQRNGRAHVHPLGEVSVRQSNNAQPSPSSGTASHLASRHQVSGNKHIVLVVLNRQLVRPRVSVLH